MPLDHLAFDIETIPGKPLELYSESARAIIEKKIARGLEYDPEMCFDKFASLNADFGRIICISVGYVHNGRINLKSLCGDDEREILAEFKRATMFRIAVADFSGTLQVDGGACPWACRRQDPGAAFLADRLAGGQTELVQSGRTLLYRFPRTRSRAAATMSGT